MDNLVSGKRFKSLLDAVEPDQAGLGPSVGDNKTLGPAVGGDRESDNPTGTAVEGKRNDAVQSGEWREEELDDDVLERAGTRLASPPATNALGSPVGGDGNCPG